MYTTLYGFVNLDNVNYPGASIIYQQTKATIFKATTYMDDAYSI